VALKRDDFLADRLKEGCRVNRLRPDGKGRQQVLSARIIRNKIFLKKPIKNKNSFILE
jgi:hypothetical protein